MKRWLVLLLLGCTPTHPLPPELAESGLERVPPVISSAAAVLFWLPSVDSLPPDSTYFATQLLSEAADDLSDLFSDTDISVLVTTRTRIYVEAPRPRAPRRLITLAGLDYPWGVVFIEPGYAEQIVTGPVAPSDLRELAVDYFGLEDEEVKTPIAGNSKGRFPIAHCPMMKGCELEAGVLTGTTFEMGNGQWAMIRLFFSAPSKPETPESRLP